MKLHYCPPSVISLFLEFDQTSFNHSTQANVFSKSHVVAVQNISYANFPLIAQESKALEERNVCRRSLSFFSLEGETLNKNEEKIRAVFENTKQESKEIFMQFLPSTDSVILEKLTPLPEKKTPAIPIRLKNQLTEFFKKTSSKNAADTLHSHSHVPKGDFKTKVLNKYEILIKNLKKKKNKGNQAAAELDLKSKKFTPEFEKTSSPCLSSPQSHHLQKPASTSSVNSSCSSYYSDSAEEIGDETLEAQVAQMVQDEIKTEVLSFLNELNFQIGKDEKKLKNLKKSFDCQQVEGQDHLDRLASLESLEKTLNHEKIIRDKINQTGVKILHQIKKEGAKELEIANEIIDSSIEEGEKTITQFQELTNQLLSKNHKAVSKQLEMELIKVCEECRVNLNQARARQQNADLWGLLGTWKLKRNSKKLITTKKTETGKFKKIIPEAVEMTNKVISPARCNTAEILPDFIKRLHDQLFIKGCLKQFIESNQLAIPGFALASFSEDQQVKNLEFFKKQSLGHEIKAQNLNTTYNALWENYRSRGSNPNAYMTAAKKFSDLLDQTSGNTKS